MSYEDFRYEMDKFFDFVPKPEDVERLFQELSAILAERPEGMEIKVSQKEARKILQTTLRAYGGMRATAFAPITQKEVRRMRTLVNWALKGAIARDISNAQPRRKRQMVLVALEVCLELYDPETWQLRDN